MEYRTSQNLFRQLVANNADNLFTVGNCDQSIVNFTQFLACLGLSFQDTTTLTATFTEAKTISSGFTTFTVGGCTPAGFLYPTCPPGSASTTNLPEGIVGTVASVLNSLLPSPTADIVNPTAIANVGSTLPLPGQGVLPGQGSTEGLLPEGTGNILVVGGLLPGQGDTTGSLPVIRGLPSGGQGSTSGLPILEGLLGLGELPVLGGGDVLEDGLQPEPLSYRFSFA